MWWYIIGYISVLFITYGILKYLRPKNRLIFWGDVLITLIVSLFWPLSAFIAIIGFVVVTIEEDYYKFPPKWL